MIYNDIQYYIDAKKRDEEHEKEPMPIIHTGGKCTPRKCPYCENKFDSLRQLYNHLKEKHPDKPITSIPANK